LTLNTIAKQAIAIVWNELVAGPGLADPLMHQIELIKARIVLQLDSPGSVSMSLM